MAKNTRGLPPNFNLNIPDSVRDEPVQLGDYLDEVDASSPVVRPSPAPRKPPEMKVVEMPRAHEEPTPAPPAPVAPAEPPRVVTRSRKKTPKLPQRKQVNMTPETLRMIEELIDHVQTYSVQRDAKGSEIFHGLVLALYEAREHIDLSDVPARGRWGTPTAQSFPISLKNAFQAAIATAHKLKNRR